MNKIRKVENEDDVVDMEEMNPVWLKDKGKYENVLQMFYRTEMNSAYIFFPYKFELKTKTRSTDP